jgi:uncharacterized membrane protein
MSDQPNSPNPFGAAANNPFKAPNAVVDDVSHSSQHAIIPGGRSVPSGNGMNWISAAWKVFTANPLIWIVMAIIAFVIIMVLSLIPLIGSVATAVIFPFFMAGIAKGAKAIDDGENLELGHMFAGFSEKGGPLAIVGVLYFAAFLVIGVLVAILAFVFGGAALATGFAGAMSGNERAAAGLAAGGLMIMLVIFLLFFALMVPVIMAFWFAPALVMLNNYEPIPAVKESFGACLKNIVPFLLYGVVAFVILIVAAIPLGLGLLVAGPVLYITPYTGYKDIFFNNN